MRNLIAIAFCWLVLAQVNGQSFERSYAQYVDRVRPEAVSGRIPTLPYDLLREQKSVSRVLPVIDNVLSDSLVIIRRLGYQSLDVLQGVFNETIEKQQILGLQFKGLEDPASEIQTISLDNISEVSAELFTVPQKSRLIAMLKQNVASKEVLVELVGKLGDNSAIPDLRSLSQPGNSPKMRWAAYLALARLGDQSAIATIESKVRNLEVDSDVVYNVIPGLIYTNQKQLYDYLVQELNKAERNCEPADPDQVRSINCAFRILELLAPKIEGYNM